MRPKVNFADVVVAQHSGVSGVGGVVGSTVVDGAAGWEGQAGFQSVFFDELPGAVLQPLTGRSRKQHKGTMDGSNNELIVRADNASGRGKNHKAALRLSF